MNTTLQMLKGTLLLQSHITKPKHSLETDQDCKVGLVLENTNTLFYTPEEFL